MNLREKVIGVCFIIALVSASFLTGKYCERFRGDDRRARDYTSAERAVVDELAGEQRDSLDRTTTAIGAVDRIGRIVEATDSTLYELGLLDRRSTDIYGAIRAKLQILEDYFDGVRGIISGPDNSDGSDEVE